MTPHVITSLDQVTPAWLTAVLTAAGALTAGTVINVDFKTGGGNWSRNAVLSLCYSQEATGARPERLFLKMVQTNHEIESFGNSEVTYYTRDYIDVPDAPLVSCYDAAYSETQKAYHLLLHDLSPTHVQATEKAVTPGYGLTLAEGLANLHARWWGKVGLAAAGAALHAPPHIQRFVDLARPGVAPILDRYAAELEPHWPALIHDLFGRHPSALIARCHDPNGFTLVHGDAGPYNILVPRSADHPLYLLDRQPFDWSLTVWLGVYDLAFNTVFAWDIETRRRLEMAVLRHYHEHLVRHGVQDYNWERLFDDYRLCAAMGVYIATEFCRGGLNEPWTWVWLPMLKKSLAACDDLNAGDLW